jgi:hypothetical protein
MRGVAARVTPPLRASRSSVPGEHTDVRTARTTKEDQLSLRLEQFKAVYQHSPETGVPPETRSIGFWNAVRSGLAFTIYAHGQCDERRFRRATPMLEAGWAIALIVGAFSLIAASAFRYDGDLATQDGVGHDYFPA